MSELDKYAEPLAADANVILKLPEPKSINVARVCVFDGSQSLYMSSKDFVDKSRDAYQNVSHSELFDQGLKVTKLESGKKWITGNIRFRLVIEFVPDEPEITTESFFDDIRKAPMNGH